MNLEENRNFESSLKKIRPSKTSQRIPLAIEQRLLSAKRSRRLARFRSGLGWGVMALAASLLITFGFLLFNGRIDLISKSSEKDVASIADTGSAVGEEPVSLEDSDSFQPVLAENNLKNRVDEGIVFLRNGLTARRYRYEFIDRVVWKNPTSGAIVEMEIPRDEVVLVPVQTF